MDLSILSIPAWTLVIFSLFSTCGGPPVPVPVEPGDTANCAPACENLRKLGCPEGDPLEGVSCEDDCIKIQQSGHALNPTCVMNLNSCHDIANCQVNRRGAK